MFRQRTSSAKPRDELLANFRQQFPEVAAATSSQPAGPASTATAGDVAVLPVTTTQQQERSRTISQDAFHDQDPTPRAHGNEQWRFTPSLLDPNSFTFTAFANQPPGYYTPTPGGTNTLYHPQAGDLHTPNLGLSMGIGTPLSMPTSEGALHTATAFDLTSFPQHGVHPQHFQAFNPFVQPPPAAQQTTFAPSTFVHQDTGYETMEHDGSPMDSDPSDERLVSIDSTFQGQTLAGLQARQFGMSLGSTLPSSAEKFRFHSTLNAPTAMIKHADEIPVTYLNKGQAYSLSIVDTTPHIPIAPGTRFRTFVRVSFEDEQQRQKPGVCWGLWKEGRGTTEAHQRGGKLQAVEFVEAGQPAEGDDKRTRIELESASFDGFSVVWTPGIHGAAECNIAVRFNFLSTDFSHSKGVKGIPVRLCAKTTPLSEASSPGTSLAEICFCKVKLFRDHGAERKLSNDVAHVKKTIEKLKQQIGQAESGMKDFGKRKRSSAAASKGQDLQRPGKALKHKRTWSMSSTSSAGGGAGGGGGGNSGGGRMSLEDDLHFKLQTLQDMFTSTRPVSVLYLRGDDLDDPDKHPVALPGESADLAKIETRDSNAWRSERESGPGSSLVSPTPSSMSLQSQVSVSGPSGGWAEPRASVSRQPSDQPTRVNRTDEAGNLSGWIEALGVDPQYRPPVERPPKPVACFYVLRKELTADGQAADGTQREYHRAIYLRQRTLHEFVARVAAKWGIDVAKVKRTVHVLGSKLEVAIDDDVVRELSEGQDMMLEVVELPMAPVKREWEMAIDLAGDTETITQGGYEFRLTF